MTDFKAKMHQIRFRTGLRPRPRWGSLQRSPDLLDGFGGPLCGRGRGWTGEEKGKGREGEVDGREREGPKLLLNQGPSETCYATAEECNFVGEPWTGVIMMNTITASSHSPTSFFCHLHAIDLIYVKVYNITITSELLVARALCKNISCLIQHKNA